MRRMMMVVASLALSLAAWTADAGQKYAYPVGIDLTHRQAWGAFGTARNDPNGAESIYCFLLSNYDSQPYIWCSATDASWRNVGCSSMSPSLITVLQNVQDSAYIVFQWDASGNCTYISSMKGSITEPKQP